ncbi:MAG TPA: CocE/NonD family hydrolase, partial [Thermoanaerobaculia bacterium]|nr:CocE/NonD family hydrolase [Thermoanaerobaculia bacterium]
MPRRRNTPAGPLGALGRLAPAGRLAAACRLAGPALAVAFLALACAPGPDSTQSPAVRGEPASRFGNYGDDSPAPYDGRNRYSVYVPMKDGTRVAVDYYLPTANGAAAVDPLPVVLHYTRYIRAFEDEAGELHTALDRDPVLRHLSSHGFAIAVADARGTGASFGVNNGAFSTEETADSYDIIQWLAAQPWSTGKVGMHGRSYPGMTQYQAATQAPPGLVAIFAEMAGPNAYDFVFTGGTYKKDFVDQWGRMTKEMDLSVSQRPARVDEDTDGALRDRAVAEHAKNLWAHDILADPASRFRNYEGGAGENGASWSWDAIATIDDTDAIERSGVAIYHLVGWYDIYTTQQPFLYASLDGVPQKMMIGPWVHSGGYGGTVHRAEILRWYDYWLKGIENGILDEEPVHYYVMQGNHTVPTGAPPSARIGAESDDPGGDTPEAGDGARAPEDGARVAAGAPDAEDGASGDEAPRMASLDETRAEDGATWIATREWPPAGISRQRWSLAAGPSGTIESVNDGALVAAGAGGAGVDRDADAAAAASGGASDAGAETIEGGFSAGQGRDQYQVDYTSRMGSFSRWMNGYGAQREEPRGTAFFDERTSEDVKALTYTSPPLAESLTIVGYPVAHLFVTSTHPDGDVF